VSSRALVLAVAAAGIALTLAQVALPGAAFYHTWQYALALAAAMSIPLLSILGALRGELGPRGGWIAIAIAGALVIDGAGLASGLLGPDTANVIATPGTVAPIPALGAAAFFGGADAAAVARGDATIVLRRRGASAFELAPPTHHLDGEFELGLQPRPAAFIEAWDARGQHLTVTQPDNASFLSPVLLFRQKQRLGTFEVPIDVFATPGSARLFRALYFTPRDLASFHRVTVDASRPALILSASDENGRPLGIVLAPSGTTVTAGDVRIRATLGTYPALSIASAPPAWALLTGLGLFALGLIGSVVAPRRRAAAVQPAGF
jgi:hypothetical protein